MDGRVQHDSNLMIIEREHGIFYLENGRPGFFRPREHVTDHDALMGLTVKSMYATHLRLMRANPTRYEGRLNFFACALISFTTDLGFAIVIPSLWPYLKVCFNVFLVHAHRFCPRFECISKFTVMFNFPVFGNLVFGVAVRIALVVRSFLRKV